MYIQYVYVVKHMYAVVFVSRDQKAPRSPNRWIFPINFAYLHDWVSFIEYDLINTADAGLLFWLTDAEDAIRSQFNFNLDHCKSASDWIWICTIRFRFGVKVATIWFGKLPVCKWPGTSISNVGTRCDAVFRFWRAVEALLYIRQRTM